MAKCQILHRNLAEKFKILQKFWRKNLEIKFKSIANEYQPTKMMYDSQKMYMLWLSLSHEQLNLSTQLHINGLNAGVFKVTEYSSQCLDAKPKSNGSQWSVQSWVKCCCSFPWQEATAAYCFIFATYWQSIEYLIISQRGFVLYITIQAYYYIILTINFFSLFKRNHN